MAQPGAIPFRPVRTPNRTKGRARFLFTETTGTWAMEILHIVTGIGDYYNGVLHPGRFDVMADNNASSHPSTYTKLEAGWLDASTVRSHRGAKKEYALHAIALPHPVSAGKAAAVKVQAPGSDRYLIIEARLRSDRWDRGFTAAAAIPEVNPVVYPGIPSEGVVIYEFAPESDPWERRSEDPNGPWPPLELRAVLTVGQTFTHFDSSTPSNVRDVRSGRGRARTVAVRSEVAGGFVVEVSTDEPP